MRVATLDPAREEAARRRDLANDLASPAIRSVRLSRFVALTMFIGLLALGALAPIASGTLAAGQIAVQGERKVIQHASGGVVSAILVSEGDAVHKGDVLLRLDALQAGAAANVVNGNIDALRAEEAVRLAEATGQTVVVFPKEMVDRRANLETGSLLAAEQAAFDTRLALARSGMIQLDEQLTQIDQSIASAQSNRKSQAAQAALLEEELGTLRPLLEKGLTLKSRVLALERSLEAARGETASLDAEVGRLTAKASETRQLRLRIDVDRRAEAAGALRTLRADLAEALNRQLAANDTLQRTEIRSPIDGVVMAMRVATLGGVIEPGQPLLEIVPQDERLVARVRISPQDADDVHRGMPATVRLSAGGSRSPVSVEGQVQSISADAISDPRTGESYFEVRVEIPTAEAEKAASDVLAPGLPAEVLIKTGEHTLLTYLMSPIEQAMFRAAREK